LGPAEGDEVWRQRQIRKYFEFRVRSSSSTVGRVGPPTA
jgi:hypothetical protein